VAAVWRLKPEKTPHKEGTKLKKKITEAANLVTNASQKTEEEKKKQEHRPEIPKNPHVPAVNWPVQFSVLLFDGGNCVAAAADDG